MDPEIITPDADTLDYLELGAFGEIPVSAQEQVPLELLQEFAENGKVFTSNADVVEDNWMECVSQLPVFLQILQILLEYHDIEAVLVLVEKNNYYVSGGKDMPTTDYFPYYMYVLLHPELFTYDNVHYLLSSMYGVKTTDVNGKIIEIPPNLRITKEDVYYKVVGLNEDNIDDIYKRVDKIYREIAGPIDAEFYKSVRQMQIEYAEEEYPLDDIICECIAESSPYADVPPHVIRIEEPPNMQEILDNLTKIDDSYILDSSTAPPSIRRELITNPAMREPYRREYSKSRSRFALERSLFLGRLFGPVNRRAGDLLLGDDSCSIYGGCRMLICPCLDGPDWFVGYCMYCIKRIRNVGSSVRIPYMEGRWYGCYCSFKCCEDAIREEYSAEIAFDLINVVQVQKKLSQLNTFVPLYLFNGGKNTILRTGIFNMNDNDPSTYVSQGDGYQSE